MKYNTCWENAVQHNFNYVVKVLCKTCFVALTEIDEFSSSGDSDTGTGSSLATPCADVLVDLALLGTFNINKKSILEKSKGDVYFQYEV